MTSLELSTLSLNSARVGGERQSLSVFGKPDVEDGRSQLLSFTSSGVDVSCGGTSIHYIFVYFADGYRPWRCRINGEDHYGPPFKAFRGDIQLQGDSCLDSICRFDSAEWFFNSTRFRNWFSDYEHSEDARHFKLKCDPDERRIGFQYDAARRLVRLVLH